MRRPLLIIDGDSFAHRAYHALPKTIRRDGNRPAGAILGFANFLLRFYESENPRAVLVGWDTLDERTYRHEALEAYQAGRVRLGGTCIVASGDRDSYQLASKHTKVVQ